MLASQTLRELTARLANMRTESVGTLSARANGYVTTARTRAAAEYDKLAKRGEKALNGRSNGPAKGAATPRKATAATPAPPSPDPRATPGGPRRAAPPGRARCRGYRSRHGADRAGTRSRLSAQIVAGPDNLEACSPPEF